MSPRSQLDHVHAILAGMYVEMKDKTQQVQASEKELDEEVERQRKVDIITLVSYIESLFEIVLGAKVDENTQTVANQVRKELKRQHEDGKFDMSSNHEEFEKQIIKLEAEV